MEKMLSFLGHLRARVNNTRLFLAAGILVGCGAISVAGQTPCAQQLFQLSVSYHGSPYTIYFYGDISKYIAIQNAVACQAPLAAQADYLFLYPQTQAVVFPQQPSTLAIVQQTFMWAYSYTNFFCYDKVTGAGKNAWEQAYAALLPAISNAWQQQAGIYAYAALNAATIVAPAIQAITAGIGGATEAQEISNQMSLWDNIVKGQPGQTLSVLERYGLVSGPGYTSSEVITNLAKLSAASLSQLTSDAYQAAYMVAPSSKGNSDFDKAISNTVSTIVASATDGAATFLEF